MVVLTSRRPRSSCICSLTVEVAAGAITTRAGDHDLYVRERAVQREQLIAHQKRQAVMLAKEEVFSARFGARASHAAQVQADPKEMKVCFAPVARSGDIVVRMEDLSKAWPLPDGSLHPVFHGLTVVVKRRDKIALTGDLPQTRTRSTSPTCATWTSSAPTAR